LVNTSSKAFPWNDMKVCSNKITIQQWANWVVQGVETSTLEQAMQTKVTN
jgi:hypothetical protein